MDNPIEAVSEERNLPETNAQPLASHLATLEQRLRSAGHPGEAIVERCRQCLVRPRAGIAFGGLFKAGKSTLLNGLLGRPVLPTDELPETGAVCVVRSGDEDRGLLVRTAGTAEPMELEDVRRLTGLVDEDGRRREDGLGDLDRLELAVVGTKIPDGAEWIDSPGIDDSPLMTAAAARAAEQADLLVWVLSSRHPLTEQEMDFLAERVERSGTVSVLFVLNVIGGEEAADGERLLRALEPKLSAFWDGLGAGGEAPPPVVPVDARTLAEAGRTPTGELEALLHERSRADHPTILRVRAHRIAEELRDVRHRLERERAPFLEREERDRRNRENEERVRAELRREIEEHLVGFCRSWRAAVEAEMERAAPRLDVLLRAVGAVQEDELRFPVTLSFQAQEDLVERLDEVAMRWGLDPLHQPKRADLRGRLLPPALGGLRIEPGRGEVRRSVAVGAERGSAVPVVGRALGGLIGGVVGFHEGHRQRERAAAQAVQELRESVHRCLKAVESRVSEVRDWIVESLAGPEPGPAVPPPEVVAFERNVESLELCLELASDLARGKCGAPGATRLPEESSAQPSGNPSAEPDPLEARMGAFW